MEVTESISHFFLTGRIMHEINHTFLTFVRKTQNASSLSDYRPISCCNIIYKFISKILSNRLQVLIGDLISHNQHVFLKGRNISDCSLLAHELIGDFNKPMGNRVCLKINLERPLMASIETLFFSSCRK